MSIYGESSNQFRTKPAGLVISIFTLLTTLVGLMLGPLLFSLFRTLVTRSLRADYVFNLHAPLGANPSLGLFPLHADQIVIGAAAAAAAITLLTTLFVAVYPASQRLANRLALYTIGTATLASGAIATVADLRLLRSLSRWREIPEPASGGAIALLVVLILCVVVWLERRTISLLGNLFAIDNPLQRLVLWALRVPLPWGAFSALCYLSDWWGGVIAASCVMIATAIDELVHYPSLRYETLEHPKMYEGLAAAMIVTALLAIGSIWAFGFPAARLAPRAIVWEAGSVSIVPVSDLTTRIQEETMPRLQMKWSDEK